MRICSISKAALLVLLLYPLGALSAITLDPEFDPGPGTELYAEHVIPLASGKILVCGAFRWYDLQPVPYILRLTENGMLDPSFQKGVVNDWVRHMALQKDGKIVIAGAFSATADLSRNLIARLNADGSADPSFDPGTGFTDKLVPPDPNPPYVFWHAIQPDGKIVAVGSFATFNGQPARGIARLNPDGSLDTTFRIGSGLDSWGRYVTILPNQQILVTGWFTDYNGFSCNRMVLLNPDGTPDPHFRPYFGDKTAIYSAVPLPDGRYLVSGHSKNDQGLFKREVARLNSDGSQDDTFLAHTDNRTESILLLPNGQFYACGWFDLANNQPRGLLARFNPDGSLDESFRADAEFFIWNMALDTKGRLLVVGGFPTITGVHRNGIARLVENPPLQPQGDPPAGAALQIADQSFFSNLFRISVQTATNGTYYLERRSNFTLGSWETIDSLAGNGALRTLLDFNPPTQQSCYRVRYQ